MMLQCIIEYFRPPPLRDARALFEFLAAEASYLAQRATYEFCRNTLSYYGQHHFGDDGFNRIFAVSRWEAFAAILADLFVLAESRLRAAAPAQQLADPLLAGFGRALDAYPRPAHRAEGWGDVVDALRARLQDAGAAATASPVFLAKVAARRIYDTLPIYSQNKPADRQGIARAVQFGMVAIDERLVERLDSAGVVADLLRTP